MMLRNLAVDFRGFCEDGCLQAVEQAHGAGLSMTECPGCHQRLARTTTGLGTWHLVPATPARDAIRDANRDASRDAGTETAA